MTTKKNCITITCKGKRCLYYCKGKNVHCTRHTKECKKAVIEYHKVCDPIWKKRCKGQKMSNKDKRNIYDISKKCARLRINHGLNCCNGYVDQEHYYGAIRKMQLLSKECKVTKKIQRAKRQIRPIKRQTTRRGTNSRLKKN